MNLLLMAFISSHWTVHQVATANQAVLQLFACGPVLYPLDWFARSQLGSRTFLRYVSATLATALIHTVHGGAEPRACLTELRV